MHVMDKCIKDSFPYKLKLKEKKATASDAIRIFFKHVFFTKKLGLQKKKKHSKSVFFFLFF